MEEMEIVGNFVIILCMDDMWRVKNVDFIQFLYNFEVFMNQWSFLGFKIDFFLVFNCFEEICLIFLM